MKKLLLAAVAAIALAAPAFAEDIDVNASAAFYKFGMDRCLTSKADKDDAMALIGLFATQGADPEVSAVWYMGFDNAAKGATPQVMTSWCAANFFPKFGYARNLVADCIRPLERPPHKEQEMKTLDTAAGPSVLMDDLRQRINDLYGALLVAHLELMRVAIGRNGKRCREVARANYNQS